MSFRRGILWKYFTRDCIFPLSTRRKRESGRQRRVHACVLERASLVFPALCSLLTHVQAVSALQIFKMPLFLESLIAKALFQLSTLKYFIFLFLLTGAQTRCRFSGMAIWVVMEIFFSFFFLTQISFSVYLWVTFCFLLHFQGIERWSMTSVIVNTVVV